jgi:hypothetical protein
MSVTGRMGVTGAVAGGSGASAGGAVAVPAAVTDPDFELVGVLGETRYDQVTSFLMAVVLGAIMVVGWLGLVYVSNQAYGSRVTSPISIIEVSGGGGGSPDGTAGSTEKIDLAGADAAALASNNEEAPADFEEPSVQQAPAAMLDSVAEAGESLAEVDLAPVMPTGGAIASGKRASKLGTGGPGYGFGPGDGGVTREQRWSIIYDSKQTPDEYARQLDALRVELAVVRSSDQLEYVSNFSSPKPTRRLGNAQSDGRLYFLWEGRVRKQSDIALLKKADIDVGEGVVLQFYPKEAENRLAELEVRFKGRQPGEIRLTRFSVVPKGDSYDFSVLSQEPLR